MSEVVDAVAVAVFPALAVGFVRTAPPDPQAVSESVAAHMHTRLGRAPRQDTQRC